MKRSPKIGLLPLYLKLYDDVAAECERVSRQLGLPACDVIRHGPDRLVEAALRLRTNV